MLKALEGKRVFVTGADGFIGSHLTERLVELGANVKALVYYNSWGNDGWLNDIPDEIYQQVEVVRGDVRDTELMANLIKGCEFVFHLASLIAIPHSYVAPRSYVDTNVSGTLNVLQACLSNPQHQKLVHFSTSEVYGTAQFVPISENHPLVGQSPYSASKIAADKMVESFYASYELPSITARPFNTFGPRQTPRAVIPTIISQALSKEKQLNLGDTTPTRDFNFVLDTTEAVIHLSLANELTGKVVNIGSGRELSISEVAHMILSKCGSDAVVETDKARLRPNGSEVQRLLADNSLLRASTEWSQLSTFEVGLEKTIDWFTKNSHLFDPKHYSV